MNFDRMIKDYSELKYTIEDYALRPDKSLRVEDVCVDKKCELGRWLHSEEGRAYAHLSEYQELLKEHKTLHFVMGEIVQNANKGVKISGDMAFGVSSPFIRKSEVVIKLLMKLRQKVEEEKTEAA